MEINVDLTNIPEAEALPESQYLCQVEKIERKVSKKNNPYLDVSYIVAEPVEYAGRRILFDNLTLTEAALWRVRDFVNACGVFPGPTGFKTEELIGAFLRVTLVREPRMTQKVDAATGAVQLLPMVDKDGKPVYRNKVTGYAPR
jgi:hypothetical protein